MSTAFVNANQPKGSLIEERLYDLYDLKGGLATGDAMAVRLKTMPAKDADEQVLHFQVLNNGKSCKHAR